MSELLPRLRQSVRGLARRPGFTLIAVATLALGIGGTATVFSIVQGVLLRSLPYAQADRLVTLDVRAPTGFLISLSIPNYEDWRDRNRVFDRFGAAAGWSLVRPTETGAEVVDARLVLGDFFETLGIAPALGRTIPGDETGPGAAPVVVLGHGFWQRAFGGDPTVIGRALTLDGVPYTIIGVMPAGFGYPGPEVEVYAPMGVIADDLPWSDRDSSFGTRAIARLAPGVGLAAAQADMDRVSREVEELEGSDEADAELRSFADFFLGDVRVGLWLLMGAVGFVLLIACANVANLVLARGEGRAREIAVRTALGATRGSIVRQQLLESTLLAAAGALLGLGLAAAAVRVLPGVLARDVPALVATRVAVDPAVVGFVIGVSALTVLLVGLLPALRSSAVDPGGALKGGGGRATGGREGQRLRAALVVTQVALSLVLLVGAGLLVRSLQRLGSVDKGFHSDGVMTARLRPPRGAFQDRESWIAFHDALLERLRARPDVNAAAATLLMPLSDRSWERRVLPEGVPWDPEKAHSVLYDVVSEDYFHALGIPILRGRGFGDGDREGVTPVVIIDESMAERYWPGEDPIGKRITFEETEPAPGEAARRVYRTVVGLVPNVRHYELSSPSRIQVFVPLRQSGRSWGMGLYVAVKADGEPAALAGALRREVAALAPGIPITDLRALDDYVDDELFASRALGVVFSGFGAGAVLLAALGIFGVLSLLVGRRTREIGVRMAVGARAGDVLRLVARQGLGLACAGVLIGLPLAAGLSRFLASLLFEVDPIEPGVYGALAALLLVVACVATYLPAARAARLDPAHVLRTE